MEEGVAEYLKNFNRNADVNKCLTSSGTRFCIKVINKVHFWTFSLKLMNYDYVYMLSVARTSMWSKLFINISENRVIYL